MYVTFDRETTIVEKHKRKANPLIDENFTVCSGFLYVEGEQEEYVDKHIHRDGQAVPDDLFREATLVVGQNIRFDLMYDWRNPQVINFFKRGGKVWDIQYAEYLLTGQETTCASLDQMARKYGFEVKPDKIKKYWEKGICTTLIPISELLPYQEHDVRTTNGIFRKQYAEAKRLGMLNTIWAHMDGLMALLEMEYNGLFIDLKAKEEDQSELEERIKEIENKLYAFIDNQFPDLPFQFNWASKDHVSALFFGGVIKYVEREHIGYAKGIKKVEMTDEFGDIIRFKSGAKKGQIRYRNHEFEDKERPKFRNNEKFYKFKRVVQPQSNWKTKKEGVYSVDKHTIMTLSNKGSKIAKILSEYNKAGKDLSTYYNPIDSVLYDDGIIHHMLNPTVAITGRLSSSNPNLQNLPSGEKSKCRRMFTSRFGEEGSMIEVDESQLEVVIQAWFSGDEQMINDVNDGVDFHCKRLAQKMHKDYEYIMHECHEKHNDFYLGLRKKIKVFSFQRAYGAGSATIAAETGLSIAEVKMLEKDENIMYPAIEQLASDIVQSCEDSREWTPYSTEGGEVKEKGYYTSVTGKKYTFKTIDLPDYKKASWAPGDPRTQFYMPHIKNYPIQGGGGEIVIGLLGRLWRKKFLPTDNYGGKCFMVNTVHDCVWLDGHKDVFKQAIEDTEEILTDVQGLFDDHYDGQIVPVTFRVETEIGPNLYEMDHYKA